ncbi:hypothetical protein FRB90_012615 [Tulasnella sp. 427]|nr:hypothetical protein FRB90_012615 [Tulasnella sp. 427]
MTSTPERSLLTPPLEVGLGLKSFADLLILLGKLAAASSNHSLKALHLLSRGQDILASTQTFLQDAAVDNFLDVFQAVQELQETEIALIDSIIILQQEQSLTTFCTLNRAGLTSWYLNRISFSEQLKKLSLMNARTPLDSDLAIIMTDVVKGDDLNWATRLAGNLSMPSNADARTSLHDIITTLDSSKADNAENVQNDCILAVICFADEIISHSENRSEVFVVVGDIAAELNSRIDKALLVQSGERSLKEILDETQAEIDGAGIRLRELIPFGTDDPSGSTPSPTTMEIAKQQLLRVQLTIAATTEHLETFALCGRTFVEDDGEASTMLFLAVRLLNLTSNAITPASGINILNGTLRNVISAVARFVVAFEALCPEQGILSRRLGTLATLITQLGASDDQA